MNEFRAISPHQSCLSLTTVLKVIRAITAIAVLFAAIVLAGDLLSLKHLTLLSMPAASGLSTAALVVCFITSLVLYYRKEPLQRFFNGATDHKGTKELREIDSQIVEILNRKKLKDNLDHQTLYHLLAKQTDLILRTYPHNVLLHNEWRHYLVALNEREIVHPNGERFKIDLSTEIERVNGYKTEVEVVEYDPAQHGDIEELAKAYSESFSKSIDESRAGIKQLLQTQKEKCLLAIDRGSRKILGGLFYHDSEPKPGEVKKKLFIHTLCRRAHHVKNNIATLMITHLKKKSEGQYETFSLEALKKNVVAINIYSRLGFYSLESDEASDTLTMIYDVHFEKLFTEVQQKAAFEKIKDIIRRRHHLGDEGFQYHTLHYLLTSLADAIRATGNAEKIAAFKNYLKSIHKKKLRFTKVTFHLDCTPELDRLEGKKEKPELEIIEITKATMRHHDLRGLIAAYSESYAVTREEAKATIESLLNKGRTCILAKNKEWGIIGGLMVADFGAYLGVSHLCRRANAVKIKLTEAIKAHFEKVRGGLPKLQCYVSLENRGAQELYRQLGFKDIGVDRRLQWMLYTPPARALLGAPAARPAL